MRNCSLTSSRAWAGVFAALSIVGAASVGYAHLAISTRSLRLLVAESDLVIRARPIAVERVLVRDGSQEQQRPALRVEVLEVLKGPAVGKEIRFAQHGHGVSDYRPGEEALFFLRDVTRSRELRKLASTGALEWYSEQDHGDDYVLLPESRRETLEAARAYVAVEAMPAERQGEALRRITVKLLVSRDLRLTTSALRDLVLAQNAPLVTKKDVPALKKVIQDSGTAIGVRVGLLVELERRQLLSGDDEWVRLLRTTKGADRLTVIRAAGAHPSAKVNGLLIKTLSGSDTTAASAAAISLGSPGNAAAVMPLSKALASPDPRLALSAIRGLGAIGTKEARDVLGATASTHASPRIRRRAEAELRLLETRSR